MEFLNPLSVARGKELFAEKKFFAQCLATDEIHDFVYARAGTIPDGVTRVAKADPTDTSKMPAVGIITAKQGLEECTVQWLGILDGFVALLPGRIVVVGLDGKLTQNVPSLIPLPGHSIVQQVVGTALNDTCVMLSLNFFMAKRVG